MDLLGDKPLPILTQFFINFSTPISIGLAVLGLTVVILLFTAPKQVWTVPAGILVAVVSIIVSETAVLAFQTPFLQIVSSLGA